MPLLEFLVVLLENAHDFVVRVIVLLQLRQGPVQQLAQRLVDHRVVAVDELAELAVDFCRRLLENRRLLRHHLQDLLRIQKIYA